MKNVRMKIDAVIRKDCDASSMECMWNLEYKILLYQHMRRCVYQRITKQNQ